MPLYTRAFRCMTTDVELFLDAEGGEAALAEAERFFQEVEARFSRFLPDSELSRLNAATGRPVRVSADMAELVGLALNAAERSGGVFDPTVIDMLEAAGYDRSIELVMGTAAEPEPARPPAQPPVQAVSSLTDRWAGIRLGRRAATVELPPGVRLDLGGIAKGWAVDRVADRLRRLGPGLVNAGGDLRAWGDEPGGRAGDGWLVAVDHPSEPGKDVVWLKARNSAVATSSVTRRRWKGGHHLIDPRLGRPAATDLLSVTVVGPTAAWAEVAAKVVLVLGRDLGLAWLAGQPGLEALLASADGQFYGTPHISEVWL